MMKRNTNTTLLRIQREKRNHKERIKQVILIQIIDTVKPVQSIYNQMKGDSNPKPHLQAG